MPSGGARTRSGPAPDPKALKREGEPDWLTLPAGGRDGDEPEWPLTAATAREMSIWADLWTTPQAVAWEKMGQHWSVALMVRRMVEAEQPGSHTSTGTLVKQLMDSLGLTVPGMRSNRWQLSSDEVAVARDEKGGGGGSRDRFRVVNADETNGAA